MLAQQRHGSSQLFFGHILRAAQNDRAGMLDLVEEELAEVLDVHLALGHISHGYKAVQLHRHVLGYAFHRVDHIGKLAYAGGLDQNTVGVIGFDHLAQRLAEIAHQRAADAAGVHLVDHDAGFLQKTAIDTDLAKFIFNQHYLLALESLGKQLLNQRGLASAQKTGNNINLGHVRISLFAMHMKKVEYGMPVNAYHVYFTTNQRKCT